MNKLTFRDKIQISQVNQKGLKNPQLFIEQCEEAYHAQIKEIANEIKSLPKVKIILLAGPSSAGKTTSANLIRENLNNFGFNAEVISMDNFFINRDATPKFEDGTYDFENITTVDIPYFKNFINQILADETAKMPIFNFHRGERENLFIDIKLGANSLLIIEGIHALNPIILDNHQDQVYKIFINPNAEYYDGEKKIVHVRELRRIRRMIRDFYTRGIKPNETLLNWKNVVAGEKKFIFPYKSEANYILDSSHPYELLMFKKYLPPLLDGSIEANEIAEDLEYFDELDAELLPKNSLLQEFLGPVMAALAKENK